MIYVGCPYRHKDYKIRIDRYQKVTQYTARLMAEDHFVYSPITYTHFLDQVPDVTITDSFWDAFSLHMLSKADEFHVLCLPGWKESKGLELELEWWEFNGIYSPIWISLRNGEFIGGSRP